MAFNPWKALMLKRLRGEPLKREEIQRAVSMPAPAEETDPNNPATEQTYPAQEPQTAPTGQTRRFGGYWIRTPEGLRFVQTHVHYEND